MYKTPAQAQEFFKSFLPLVANHERDEIVVCPSFTSISVVVAAATGSGVAVGAQNMHFADEGAYTGEISPLMLKAIGPTHVILGHSERRQYFAETDELINKKLKAALSHQLIRSCAWEKSWPNARPAKPTKCWCARRARSGRHHGRRGGADHHRLRAGLGHRNRQNGHVADRRRGACGDSREVAKVLGQPTADAVRILYGGSVKPDNAASLMAEEEIDGALVGGASLDPQSFAKIVNY